MSSPLSPFERTGKGTTVAMYVYSSAGVPVGFVHGATVHDLDGWAIGRIVGTRVHRFDGSYVGEFFKDMVVERAEARARTLPPVPVARRQAPPTGGHWRRVVIDYGYADAFHLLSREETPGSSDPAAVDAGKLDCGGDSMVASATLSAAKDAEPDTVLVVDDETKVREMIGDALRELGFQVQEARSGKEAVAMIGASRPQLVILDFLMPDMDGAEVAREVSKMDPGLPIVFSTGHSALRALRNAAGSGIPVLPKPFSVAELDNFLSETLAEHRSTVSV